MAIIDHAPLISSLIRCVTRRVLTHLYVVLAGAMLISASSAGAGEINLLAPNAERSSMVSRNKIVNVVVKVTDVADLKLLLLTDDSDNHIIDPSGRHIKDNVCYVHYRVPLKKGGNSFTLAPISRKVSIRYTPLSSLLNVDLDAPGVYHFHGKETIPQECSGCHSEKLPPDAVVYKVKYGQYSPECYSCHSGIVSGAEWKHFPTNALLCRTCHQSGNDVNRLVVPTGKIEALCFDCHVNEKKWIGMSHIHGPVGTGDCTICHDPHGSGSEYQLWADGTAKLCVVCHEGMKKFLDGGAKNFVVHGILNAQGCKACHSPHATDYRFQLYSEINDLCTGCHSAMAGLENGHPIQKHPVKGKSDPLRSGLPFTCTSCHNPHGSAYKYMLIGDVRGGRVCTKCHNEKSK